MVWEGLTDDGEVLSLPWNDIIELQPVRGRPLVDELPEVEDHMMLVVTRSAELQTAVDMLLITAEPVDDPAPLARAEHSARFLDIVEELLVDAFDVD